MVNKKYLLLAGLCATIAGSPAIAQESQTNTSATYQSRDMTYRGEVYDVLDTSYVPGKRMEQHRKFLNHQYNFPAKPRNMWEVGVSAGLYNYSSDVPSLLLWDGGGFGLGFHVRKALGYVVSLRADYNYGIAKGLSFQPAAGYANNPAWNGVNTGGQGNNYGAGAGPAGQRPPVFYNYRSEAHQLNLDVVASLGNILFHKARPTVNPYIFAGLGANAYQTWINALKEDYTKYDFTTITAKYPTAQFSDRKAIKKDLKELLDDTYETDAETNAGTRRATFFSSKKLGFVTTFGAGVAFRVSKRVNIALEDRISIFPTTDEDLLDGQKWDEGNLGGPTVSPNKDGINYASVGINFNIGNTNRRVEPLYWLNPLDYSYGEMSNPRHMILPEPILPDSDGDGITDQFDKCPGTPAGVAVDSHGCPMDTDGDGVPDDRDKQLITPTYCQPVDADGVGECPCPPGCGTGTGACGNIMPGSLVFNPGSSKISPAMQSTLANLAAQMGASPECRVVIMANGGGSKAEQQRSWDRVNAVIEYMSERNNIDRNRFIFQYQSEGVPANTVMYRSANKDETGPSNVAPPHPNLRRD